MKKIIFAVSFLSLVFVFGGTYANAQASSRIDAEIPFDFVVGDKVFSAGKYVIRLRRSSASVNLLTMELRDSNNQPVYDTFAFPNGDPAEGKPALVFDRSYGQATLARIRVDNHGFSVPIEKSATIMAAKERKKSDTAAN